MRSLPVPVQFPPRGLAVTQDTIAEVCKDLEHACAKWLGDTIARMSSQLPLIQGRLERNELGEFVAKGYVKVMPCGATDALGVNGSQDFNLRHLNRF
jgi:hypothetical protein